VSVDQGEITIKRREHVLLSRTGGEALLVDQSSGKVHVVNGTAARLWELCDGNPTTTQVVESLAAAYELEQDDVREDVDAMLTTFRELGLLEFTTAP